MRLFSDIEDIVDGDVKYYIRFSSEDGEHTYIAAYETLEEAQKAVENEERLDPHEPCRKYLIRGNLNFLTKR
jgi:hypothetical protein